MIVKTKEFKEACQTILYAIDNKNVSLFTETLELVVKKKVLYLNVTNREYYTSVSFNLDKDEKFRAAVNAKTFLSLVSKITTDTIELSISNNALKVMTSNGEYTFPLIYNDDKLLELPTIDLGTVTCNMNINSSILLSILLNNSKELQRGLPVKPAQNYYYVDQQGAITFTSGACVNSFKLDKPLKILLSDKVVKLFKLFKSDNSVSFRMGQKAISNDMVQTAVEFKTDKVNIMAKLPDSSIITGVPVTNIRGMATKTFPFTMTVSRTDLLQALNRIMLFVEESKTYGRVVIKDNKITISNYAGGSEEALYSTNQFNGEYKMILDLKNLKLILDGCDDEFITMCFGDGKAVVIKKQSVYDMLPELKE